MNLLFSYFKRVYRDIFCPAPEKKNENKKEKHRKRRIICKAELQNQVGISVTQPKPLLERQEKESRSSKATHFKEKQNNVQIEKKHQKVIKVL